MYFRKAILIIHGFAGGTYDIEELANTLEYQHNFDVYTFTLPGHDKYTLTGVNKDMWIKSAEDHIQKLINEGYKKIYLIGHSMGGVIACYLASKYKEVKKLILAAPAFQYLIFKNDKLKVIDSIKELPKVLKDYNNSDVITRLIKVPIPTITEFMNLIEEHYNDPSNVNIPILIIYGKKDKLVPEGSVKHVYSTIKSNTKMLVYLNNCTHDIFRGPRKDEAISLSMHFLKNKYPSKYEKIIEK